jgi:hypothetical protein
MTAATSNSGAPAQERAVWRAVAVPAEHGGWGLTLEPVLLGLLVARSWAGLSLGLAAFLAFLVRTPLKLVLVDRFRERWLPRTAVAARIAACELMVLAALVAVAAWRAGWAWGTPLLAAAPLVAVELWFGMRSRGRRLLPELCGAAGAASVAAAIVWAGGSRPALAIACWLILAARSVGAIPFVRVQIVRMRRGSATLWHGDAAQLAAVGIGGVAIAVSHRVLVGAVAVLVVGVLHSIWLRRPLVPVKVLGLRQMALGLVVVGATALGVLI